MSIVDQAIEDSVGQRGVADLDYFPAFFFRFAQYAFIRSD
jgi:hypothetical protein